jgi:hypothetical protein
VLVLESDGQDLVWRCPDDSNIEVPFGSLSRSSG